MFPHRSMKWIRRQAVLLTLVPGLSVAPVLQAADATAAADHRSRIIESSLRDLSRSNDAAIAGAELTVTRELDAQGIPRVNLTPAPVQHGESVLEADVQSSLHRLRRETVSERATDATDDRRARIEASQDVPSIKP